MSFPVVAAVFMGGCLGGLARYVLVTAWPSGTSSLPWAVLVINCTGAFLLAVLMVCLPDGLLRRLLGTGFLGAWTTFSAVVVTADQFIAHGQALLGAGYVLASGGGGLLSAGLGFAAARQVKPSC